MYQVNHRLVYTDGFAHGSGTDHAAAAIAITQLRDRVVGATYISTTGLIPSCMPATVAAAEKVAIALGSELIGGGGAAELRSDCASAAREARNHHSVATFERPWGGLWRQVSQRAILGIQHVRAPRAMPPRVPRDQQRVDIYANAIADMLAGARAIRALPSEVAREMESSERASLVAIAKGLARRLAVWPPLEDEAAKLRRRRRDRDDAAARAEARALPRATTHHVVQRGRGWRCVDCNRRASRPSSAVFARQCAAVPRAWAEILERGALGHRLWTSAILGFESLGLVLWCSARGAIPARAALQASSRSARLARRQSGPRCAWPGLRLGGIM